LKEVARRLPTIPFLAIGHPTIEMPPNVRIRPYSTEPYPEMLRTTRVLLFPFDEDPCGTGRVTFEAHTCGIPVIAPDRGGLGEVVPPEHRVRANDDIDDWVARIRRLYLDDGSHDPAEIRAGMKRFPPEESLRVVEERVAELVERRGAAAGIRAGE
jgi:glycosyltransferase involved in cell wall biosynthesis